MDYKKAKIRAAILKALAHPVRVMIVETLARGEKCVCDLKELVGDDISTVSRHLAVLREAGIVSTEKRGTSVYYRLELCCLDNFLTCTGELIRTQAKTRLASLR